MPDLKTGPSPLFLREEELRQAIELLYFAYRGFTAEPDRILADYNWGGAHHGVIYFVGGHPATPLPLIVAILGITKLRGARVVGQHFQDGYNPQRPGPRDRRQRLLELTEKGRALEHALTDTQRVRLAQAFRESGAEAVTGFRTVIYNLIDEAYRERFSGEGAPRPAAPAAARRR